MSKQNYGYFNGSYFTIHDGDITYIPENVDYRSSAIQSTIYDGKYCVVNAYAYHSDLITTCNPQRVAYMKEFLIDEKVKEIFDLNDDYIVGVEYILYDDDGKVVTSGTSSVRAIYHTAHIDSPVLPENILEYRKGMIFDGSIEVRLPIQSAYGIKKVKPKSKSYTLKISKFLVSSTIGKNFFNIDSDEQVNAHGRYHASCCQYNLHHRNHMLFNDYSSHFLTNAHRGTTMIDQIVVPAELQIPPEYTQIRMLELPCEGNEYTVKISQPVDSILVNIEVMLDNSVMVYNKADIDAIIEANNNPDEDDDDVIVDDNPTVNPNENNSETPNETETQNTTETNTENNDTSSNTNESTETNTNDSTETNQSTDNTESNQQTDTNTNP